MNSKELITAIISGKLDDTFVKLYGKNEKMIQAQKERYIQAVKNFETLFPGSEEISVFSAPGRTEVCGNHTDHQHGCVLAAAVNLDAIAIVSFHEENIIRLQSAGYELEHIELDNLHIHPEEKGTTGALIRGMVAQFADMGVKVGGFNAFVTSDVLSGSGLSSSVSI